MLKTLKAFKGGIHPPGHKETQKEESVRMPMPEKLVIPMQQHIGAPCTPIVKKGDRVLRGQLIGEPKDRISTPVHASASGTVTAVGPMLYAGGRHVVSVAIKPDEIQETDPSIAPITTRDPAEMIQAIRDSGLVGLGGAGFPTWFKLTPPNGHKFDTLIINGAECEPYITSDYREMVENTENILKGIEDVLYMTGIPRAIIGIEDNKRKAIDRLIQAAEKHPNIDVIALKTRYPQGGEKQLIYTITGRVVEAGQLPSSIGVLVLSISTVSYVHTYLQTGMPLIERRVTVAGNALKAEKNVILPVGTLVSDVLEFVGGLKAEPTRVIMGGPMNGVGQFTLDNAILKQSNAILALTEAAVDMKEESPCIRCGRCVQVCPMNLMPLDLNNKILQGKVQEAADKYYLMSCIECGCCSYACPAARNLVQSFRLGKAELRAVAARAAKVEQSKAEVNRG